MRWLIMRFVLLFLYAVLIVHIEHPERTGAAMDRNNASCARNVNVFEPAERADFACDLVDYRLRKPSRIGNENCVRIGLEKFALKIIIILPDNVLLLAAILLAHAQLAIFNNDFGLYPERACDQRFGGAAAAAAVDIDQGLNNG